ncbi:hypothetical protein C4D60_Mb10t11410 [Musa balbisiana]|uniref:RIN4 pathogenic type III effector avirulence factor Avr cleavage site domain-containing protein n=1 Tax=Musa balbisiana TaxID=52838 RepID=A0A4S8IXP6_MUSBA|nr:hypothetical protein C4D60_Mb10t11410 [Musa balbisiana]
MLRLGSMLVAPRPSTHPFEAVKKSPMGDSKESDGGSGGWMSVPAFGEWDMKNGVPDYSMDFTKIREMRKQNKNTSRASLGNDDELRSATTNKEEQEAPRHILPEPDLRRPIHHGSPTGRKKFMGYFQCCIRA